MNKTLQNWIDVTRPKTLPAAAAPVVVGSAMAWNKGDFSFFPALAAFIGALLLQIAVNMANDYFDFIKGVDTEERLGPRRATASGLISLQKMKAAIILTISLALLDGIYLISVAGMPIVIIGVLSILSLLAYSGGPYPLASHGLGDLFVFIFFGLVAVCGTYYVQSLSLSGLVIIGSLPSAMHITAILVVNNYRDRNTDENSGKRTLAVILGPRFTRLEYLLLILLPYIIPLYFILVYASGWMLLLPFLTLPLAVSLIRQIFGTYKGAELNRTLGSTAKLSLIFSLLFSAGLILG